MEIKDGEKEGGKVCGKERMNQRTNEMPLKIYKILNKTKLNIFTVTIP